MHYVIEFITEELMRIIDENKGGFSNGEYKIRSEYSKSTFHLNNVDDLYVLIHRIMYCGGRMRPYEEFLSSKHMDEIKEYPDDVWEPDMFEMDDLEEFDNLMIFLEDIYGECIHNVYEKLKEENIEKHIEVISLKEDFKDYLEPNKYYEPYR